MRDVNIIVASIESLLNPVRPLCPVCVLNFQHKPQEVRRNCTSSWSDERGSRWQQDEGEVVSLPHGRSTVTYSVCSPFLCSTVVLLQKTKTGGREPVEIMFDPLVMPDGREVATMALLNGRMQPRGLMAVLLDMGLPVAGMKRDQLVAEALKQPAFSNLKPVLVVRAIAQRSSVYPY